MIQDTKSIKVVYRGELNEQLDKDITEALQSAGFEWYAQGYNLLTNERDIAFDIPNHEVEDV